MSKIIPSVDDQFVATAITQHELGGEHYPTRSDFWLRRLPGTRVQLIRHAEGDPARAALMCEQKFATLPHVAAYVLVAQLSHMRHSGLCQAPGVLQEVPESGLLDPESFAGAGTDGIESAIRVRDGNAALEHRSALLAVAREHGLEPLAPTGMRHGLWLAPCPGGDDHQLLLFADAGEFLCRECGERGDAAELPEWLSARRQRAG